MSRVSIYRVQLTKRGSVEFDDIYIRTPEDAKNACRKFLEHEYGGMLPDREVFGAIWLNIKNKIVGLEIVSIGSINATIVTPRETFKSGILHNAASFIVFHNHPSGNTTPSAEDINATKRLVDAGELLGIELLDHIIIGEDSYYSLKETGVI